MNKAERIGVELVTLIDRQARQERELEETRAKIDALVAEIRESDGTALYGRTGEQPIPERWERSHMINADTGEHVPLHYGDRAETLAEVPTETLPAVVPHPHGCAISLPHVHYADGTYSHVRDL